MTEYTFRDGDAQQLTTDEIRGMIDREQARLRGQLDEVPAVVQVC